MSDLSTISIMFEEIKQFIKQILSNLEKLQKSNINTDTDRGISTSDLATIENHITTQVSQSEELILSKLEQIEQAQTAPKKLHHRVSIDIASSWVSCVLVGLFLFLVASLCLCYKLKEANIRLTDNDLKYRYIKAFNKADSVSVYKLENIFEYNRDTKAINEIRQSVEQYEQDVADRARRLEQAKLKETKAQKLQEEASKLKEE